jgi:pilus assembly protein CpaC
VAETAPSAAANQSVPAVDTLAADQLGQQPTPLAAPSTGVPSPGPAPLVTPEPAPPASGPAGGVPSFVPPGQPGQQQGANLPAEPPLSRPITIQAGTGTLIHLPRPAATVMSAQPNVARVQPASPVSLFLMGVTPGRTTVIATTDGGSAIAEYDVTVTPVPGSVVAPGEAPGLVAPPSTQITAAMAKSIRAAVVKAVPGAGGVDVTAVGDNVLLSGFVATALLAQQVETVVSGFLPAKTSLIDNIVVTAHIQVNVRVRVAEISRTVTHALGFNWQALGSGKWAIGLLTGTAASNAGTTAGALVGAATAAIPGGYTPFGAASLGYSSGGYSIDGVIDALAQDQLVTILAEPNLTALSGETASFLAGGEFPIPVAGNTSNGQVTISIEFKQYGVSLTVVPTVLSDSRMNLRIRPEVSELSTTGAVSLPIGTGTLTIPALTVRRAETTVELGSGESFAIAGLLERDITDQSSALPGLGELPILGALFKSTAFQRGDSELVIVVTPYIVKPAANPQMLRAPTDNFRPATDLDRILFGHQIAPAQAGTRLDAGFMLK